MLFSQLWLVFLGGPMLVRCQQGGGEHQAIELAHTNPCGDEDPTLPNDWVLRASTPDLVSDERCVDTALSLPVVLRQEVRPSFETALVLLAYEIAVLPDFAGAKSHVSVVFKGSLHISSPDSPESLARSVMLLI